jgi:hypothetical protein
MNQTKNPANSANCCGAKHTKAEENLQINLNPSELVAQSSAAQRQRILEHLQYSPLTTFQAREELHIPHPAGRVEELRKLGNAIETVRQWEYSAGGSRHRIARYVLQQGGKQ